MRTVTVVTHLQFTRFSLILLQNHPRAHCLPVKTRLLLHRCRHLSLQIQPNPPFPPVAGAGISLPRQ